MTTHTATQLTSPHDLLAAVPFMVGYHPDNSLVVMAVKEAKITMAMRVDYPDADNMASVGALIASHLSRDRADEAIVVGYLPDSLTQADPLATLRKVIAAEGISIKECLEVQSGRFKSTMCADMDCCPPEGNPLPHMESSRVVAEQVAAGNPLPFLDLDEMKRSISALPTDEELLRLINEIEPIDYQGEDVVAKQRDGAEAINEMALRFGADRVIRDKKLIALILVRLLDLQVRDYAMGFREGMRFREGQSSSDEKTEVLWDMWRYLLRLAPAGYVAPVAVIFATISYERGDGALAQRALDRAMEDAPGYQMAKLLRRTFAAGWPPSAFTQMRADLHPKICAAIFG